MKKIAKRFLCLFIVVLVLQVIVTIVTTHHEVEYKIENHEQILKVKENFNIQDKLHYYTMEITHDKQSFYVQYQTKLRKKKKIIKDIEVLKEGEVTCLYPYLIENKESYLICQDKKRLFSYDILTKEYPLIAKKIEATLQKKKIILSKKEIMTNVNQISYQKEAIANKKLVLWNYQGVFYITKEGIKKTTLFTEDQYENSLSILVKDQYVIANTEKGHVITNFYTIAMKDGKKTSFEIKQPISKDSYIMGVVGDAFYLFDQDALLQYKITPKEKKVEVIGDKDKNGKYYDNGFKERNIYDFKEEIVTFKTTSNDKEILKVYKDAVIYKDALSYYFIWNDNLYVSYEGYKDKAILLLDDQEFKEVKVKNNTVYYIDKDSIYQYNKMTNRKKLVTHRELQFNYKNIYDVYE